jgi:hypothetical protein
MRLLKERVMTIFEMIAYLVDVLWIPLDSPDFDECLRELAEENE